MATAVSQDPPEVEIDADPKASGYTDPSDSPSDHLLEQTIIQWLHEFKTQAEGIMAPWHRRWDVYRRMKAGEYVGDDPDEPLVQDEVYLPKLAEFSDFLAGQRLQQMVPNPQTADFIFVDPFWEGMEEDCKRAEALLRHQVSIMEPDDAGSFYELMHNILQDEQDLGNAFGLIGHKVITGDEALAGKRAGPIIHRLDPRNVLVGSLQSDHLRQIGVMIYAPVTEDELDKIDYIDAERLRGLVNSRPIIRINPAAYQTNWQETFYGPSDVGWRRYILFAPLAWRRIAKGMNMPPTTKRQDVVKMLAKKYKFDPLSQRAASDNWTMEYVDDTLLCVRPYPMDLPDGCFPIWHSRFHHINSQTIGRGIYDRNSWDERLYNAYHRYMLSLGARAARPPVLIRKGTVDEDWLAERDGFYSFQPDEVIELAAGSPADTRDPFIALKFNTDAMPIMQSELERMEGNMRAGAATTDAYTGDSGAKTATLAQNNLNQSRGPEQFRIKFTENGLLRELCTRCYIVSRQVIQIHKLTQYAPISADEGKMQMAAIEPAMIRSMEFYSIRVAGSSSPQNQATQIAQFIQMLPAIQTVAAQYGIDVREIYKAIFKRMDVRESAQFFIAGATTPEIMSQVQNAIALMGPQGLAQLSPQVQTALQSLMAGAAQAGGQGQPASTPPPQSGNPPPGAGLAPSLPPAQQTQPGLTGVR